MINELEVKWAGFSVLKLGNKSAAKRWVARSLISARNAADFIRKKNRLNLIKAAEYQAFRFQINGEKHIPAEDILEKARTSFYNQPWI